MASTGSPPGAMAAQAKTKGVGKIFVSYRREDTQGITRSIYEWLKLRMPKEDIFFDVDLEYGVDFVQRIQEAIPQCKAVLVVIGPRWLGDRGSPSIYVQMEVELALSKGVQVIPVLVDGTEMPSEERLPEKMRPLVKLNAATVRSGRDFPHDMAELGKTLGMAPELLASRATLFGTASTARRAQMLSLTGALIALLTLSLGTLNFVPPDHPVLNWIPRPTPLPTEAPTIPPEPTATPAPPHIQPQTLAVFGSSDHSVYAIKLSDGSLVSSFQTGDKVSAAPAVAGDVVYTGSFDHKLYASNVADGQKRWEFSTGDVIASSPTVASGVVYVGSRDKSLYAVNAADGAKVWSYATGGGIDSSPVVASGVVYVGSGDHTLYALDATTGALRWRRSTGGVIDGKPLVAGGVVYAVAHSGGGVHNALITPTPTLAAQPPDALYALDAATGGLKWTNSPDGIPYVNATVASDTFTFPAAPGASETFTYLYLSAGTAIYAVNAANGARVWSSASLEGCSFAPPVVVGHRVYAGCANGKLYAFKSGNGATLWSLRPPSQSSSFSFGWMAPTGAGAIYATTTDGSLIVFTDSDTSPNPRKLYSKNGVSYSPPTLNG